MSGHGQCVSRHAYERIAERVDKQQAEITHLRDAADRMSHEIEQMLGRALSYPPLYPDASPVDDGTVCVGEHVPETLAMEAAQRIVSQLQEITVLRAALDKVSGYYHALAGTPDRLLDESCECVACRIVRAALKQKGREV